VADRPWLAIVSPEDFVRARETLRGRQTAFVAGDRHSNTHIFSTLIKCRHCGHSFRRISSAKWVCAGRNGRGVGFCPNKTVIGEGDLLEEICGYLARILADRIDIGGSIVGEFNRISKNRDEACPKKLEAELNRLKIKRVRELDLYTDGLIDKQELQKRAEGIDRRMAMLEGDLRLVKTGQNRADVVVGRIRSCFVTPGQALSPKLLTNATLKKIITGIEANNQGQLNILIRQQAKTTG